MSDLVKEKATLREMIDDLEADAAMVDRTPFTPRGIGTVFGTMMAMMQVLAKIVLSIAERVEP